MGRILLRILAGFFALAMLFSLLGFHPNDPCPPFSQGQVGDTIGNMCGLFGAYVAGFFQTLVGVGAWIIPIYILWECFPMGDHRWLKRIAWIGLAFPLWTILGAFGHRAAPLADGQPASPWRWGGWIGSALWPVLRKTFGPVGLPLVLGLMMFIAALILAPVLTRAFGSLMRRWLGDKAWPWFKPMPGRGARGFLKVLQRPFLGWNSRKAFVPDLDASDMRELGRMEDQHAQEQESMEALDRAEREAREYRKAHKGMPPELGLPVIHSMRLDTPHVEIPENESPWSRTPSEPIHISIGGSSELEPGLTLDQPFGISKSWVQDASLVIGETLQTPDQELPPPVLLRDLPSPPPPKPQLVDPIRVQDRFGRTVEQQPLGLTEPTPHIPLPELPTMASSSTRLTASESVPPHMPSGRVRVHPEPSPRHETRSMPQSMSHSGHPSGHQNPGITDRVELPPRRLFDPPSAEQQVDFESLDLTRELIGQKLSEFKVKGQMVGMQPGPVVTVYEFQPDPGVPLSKVMNMEEDLALGLKAEKVRIDRIAGKNLVGIEVPNARRQVISFREVVDSPVFRDPASKDGGSLLTLALGKDIAGHPVVSDLAKMPHLLIGGSTGSGKSVGVNAMICSILLRAMPSEVKLILVDPKMVEMGIYEDIPHLWAPVVTDMKEAGRVLKWVVVQMEDRYRRLALMSVRNLEGFNAKIAEAGGSIDLSDRTPNPRWPDRPTLLEPLPYVVVIIDELADLMMVARAEVEESIARIAQKARAVGIHLVLATQRPSVDIVTGVIKANLPARLSYRVNTKIDSRTILDSGGGEQLLGKGDALFLAPGHSRARRIHAPLITEDEILRLVSWLKERGKPDFNQALLNAMDADEEAAAAEDEDAGGNSGDDIYDRALAVIKRERKASTSLLQRKLNIGYGRAARIIDRMEDEGLVGPDRGAGKPREVYTSEE